MFIRSLLPVRWFAYATVQVAWSDRLGGYTLFVWRIDVEDDDRIERIHSSGTRGQDLLHGPEDVLNWAAGYAYIPSELPQLLLDDRRLFPLYQQLCRAVVDRVDLLPSLRSLTYVLDRALDRLVLAHSNYSNGDREAIVASARAHFAKERAGLDVLDRLHYGCLYCDRDVEGAQLELRPEGGFCRCIRPRHEDFTGNGAH